VGAEQRAFSYAVAGDIIDVEDAIYDFTTTLIINLTILGLGIIATTFLQVRYGLWPLRDIGARLAAIRSGEAERLEGKLPQEILPLQDELNALIQSNNHIIERARTHVGNLAHALKTPLSVILNEARGDGSPAAQKIAEQAALMREHIDHYLNRARLAARSGVVGNVTPVAPVLASLSKALARINEDRGVTISVDCPADLRFKGEKQDLEEMAGNLLDNACKWASKNIAVAVAGSGGVGKFAPRSFILTVDDDGPGMTDEQRAAVIKRGTRYDETKPGSGLGLSIVADLADLYQGKFTLEAAPSGGLRARLTLPAA
jgi:signal transduction histidine kinase